MAQAGVINRSLAFSFLFLHSVFGQGCAYTRVNLPYEEFEKQILIETEEISSALPLGVIRADAKGSVWDDCPTLVQKSLLTLADEARSKGGNAIGKIRWIPDDEHPFKTPHCKKRWGLALFFPFLFSPIFMSATVEAQAYKVRPEQ